MNQHAPDKHRGTIIYLLLIAVTLAAFWQVRDHEFVHYDDDKYVMENPHVQTGLTRESIKWAFTTTRASNWHPLTWLSHMLDCQLYGLNPRGHHVSSLLFHAANTVLLFLVLRRMTGASWKSAFVAALFAIHPLHVESVAWVAERKDVLSTLFWMLTMLAYLRYVEKPTIQRYLPVVMLFALGLMAKPMLVTLPFVLLLMDYWPLGRLDNGLSVTRDRLKRYWGLVREKLPLFALTAISCVVTFLVQRHGGAMPDLEWLPLDVRIANALVSYAKYIGKMLLPCHLAVLYPYPSGTLPLWQLAGAVFLLMYVSVMVFRSRQRYPYLAVGWAWYVGTLVPTIGIVQVGKQALADRYTYVPLIGLFIIIAWGVPDLVARWRVVSSWRRRRILLAVSATASILALMTCTWFQVGCWRDRISLYTHTLRVTSNNATIHNNLGNALLAEGKIDEAIDHFSKALLIKEDYSAAHNNLATALLKLGKLDEAIDHLSKALAINPEYVNAHNNMGLALLRQGKLDDAIDHFSKALLIKPDNAEVHNNLGLALLRQGKPDEAIDHFSKALVIKPDLVEAHNNMGLVLLRQGELDDAIDHFSEALLIKPDNAEAYNNLGLALLRQGKPDEAIDHLSKALLIKPGLVEAHNNMGLALLRQGETDEAIDHFSEALRINPSYDRARKNLERIQAERIGKEPTNKTVK